MNKLFTKIAAAFVGIAMAIGVGVAVGGKTEVKKADAARVSPEGAYTLLTTSTIGALTTSHKVVIVDEAGTKGVTGYSGSDATVGTTGWLEFTVTSVDAKNNKFSLKDADTSKWISLNASNKFTIASGSSTDLVANANGYFQYTDSKSDTRYLCKNGSYYRCYTSIGDFTPFYVYYTAPITNPIATITAVTLSSSSATIGSLDTITATATFTSENGGASDENIAWTSSNTNVATIASTSTNGVGRITLVGPGNCTFTASNTKISTDPGYISFTSSTFTVIGGESISIIGSSFPNADGGTGSGYTPYNGTRTIDNYKITTDSVMKGSYSTNYYLQFKSSSNVGSMYNKTAFSHGISMIKAEYYDDSSSINVLFSTSTENPSSGVDANKVVIGRITYFIPKTTGTYQYFKITGSGSTERVNAITVLAGQPAALDFAKLYLAALSCDSNGSSAPTYNTNYSAEKISSLYSALSDASKTVLQNAADTHTSSYGDNKIKEFGERYYWVVYNHYSADSSWDFMGRVSASAITPKSSANIISFDNNGDRTAAVIIVIISSITLLTLAGFLVIRKRKEQ